MCDSIDGHERYYAKWKYTRHSKITVQPHLYIESKQFHLWGYNDSCEMLGMRK